MNRLFATWSRSGGRVATNDPLVDGLIGVFGSADPAGELRRAGVEPVWNDGELAFGGSSFGFDRSGRVLVAGDILIDNPAELRSAFGMGNADAHELFAELIIRDGVGGLVRARGMFAGLAWNRNSRKLTLFRDGVGARTIYIGVTGKSRWFASRLAGLRRGVPGEVSIGALRDYLCFAFVPGSQTMWKNATEIRPGTAIELPDERSVSYWEPAESSGNPAETIDDHARHLRPILEDAVSDVLPPDEGVGVFLSGGLDSSLVTALAARYSNRQVRTYAIHFGDGYPNELEFSSLVASHCGTSHDVLELPAKEIVEHLGATLAALDDPIGDPLTVPNFLLGRRAARDVRVILNGEGGDPCFGGPKNGPMILNEIYPTGSREAAYLRSYQKCYDDLPELLTSDAKATLASLDPPERVLDEFLVGDRMPDYLNRLMHINVRLKGADHILTKVSNLTSANGLLGRSPLFDRRIVDACFGIPPAFKLDGADEKAVLKRAVADLLPARILTRPKSGMLVPVQRWFKQELKPVARDLLLGRDARTRPFLNQALIREWIDYRGELWPRQGVKLWLVLTLELWLRIHG